MFVNDAEAFGLGEWRAGAARGRRRAVAITLGTGVGSVFVADGGAAMPMAHIAEVLDAAIQGRPAQSLLG